MTSLNDQKNKINFFKNSAMFVKETPVTLVTITQLCNVQKDLVNPSNKFPINYKRSFWNICNVFEQVKKASN